MSAASESGAGRPPAFAAGAVLALVLTGIVAFAGLAVLSAYAPDLRSGQDGRAHALSKSAVGYAGAPILLKAMGETVVVSRTRAQSLETSVVVLTPDGGEKAEALAPFAEAGRILVVLPKWAAAPDPFRQGFVRKAGLREPNDHEDLLSAFAKETKLAARKGEARTVLRGAGGPFPSGTQLSLGSIDRLQTVSGEGWAPALVDETGAMVLAYSRKQPNLWVLAEPDLLNNQGLKSLDNARAAAAILDAASARGEWPVVFDVTLAGFERGRGLGRLMLEPPWLAATLIAVAAGVLMGLHALARFGQPLHKGRALPLGAQALVENTAGLVRAARKEHELAPAYAALTRGLVTRAGGGHVSEEHWLEDLAQRRGATAPAELAAEAEAVKTRDDLLAVARRLYEWRGEMMRERR